jgi:hypothetical protein
MVARKRAEIPRRSLWFPRHRRCAQTLPRGRNAALFDGRKRTMMVIGAVILSIALWFSFNAAELLTISNKTPRPSNTAFGCQVLASYFLEGSSRQPFLAQWIEVLGGAAACQRILSFVSVTGYGLVLLTAGIPSSAIARNPSHRWSRSPRPWRQHFSAAAR